MKSKLQQTVTALATAFAAAWMNASALASPPYVNYQGTINDSVGNPINTNTQALTFNIYDAATGGSLVWGPFNVTTPVLNGRFNVILGPSDTAVPSRSLDTVFGASNDRYLAVTVGGTTIAPRQRFLANPYAYSASSVANPRYEITPTRFAVLGNNVLEFGGGITSKAAGNGNVAYGANSLDIVGGGSSVGNRLTTIHGNLVVSNVGAPSTLTVQGTIRAASFTDSSNRVVLASRLADMSDAIGNLRIVYGRVSADRATAEGTGFTAVPGLGSSVTLNFDPPFAAPPMFMATANQKAFGTPGIVSLEAKPTINSVSIATFGGTDRFSLEFNFIAIGPR